MQPRLNEEEKFSKRKMRFFSLPFLHTWSLEWTRLCSQTNRDNNHCMNQSPK